MSAIARNPEETSAFAPALRLVTVSPGVIVDMPVVPAEQHLAMGIISTAGIEARFQALRTDIPWLKADTIVPLRLFNLVRGTSVLYGSLVGAHTMLTKLADNVDRDKSKQVETALFTSLPDWLKHYDMPAITTVDKRLCALGLYKVSRGSHDPARLFFMRTTVDGLPTILKVAVARHKAQGTAVRVMTRQGKPCRLPQHFNG